MYKKTKIKIAFLLFLLINHSLINNYTFADTVNKFKMKTVVIDAGHGGHDSGCHGHTGSYEKNVTLAIALALGKKIEAEYPNIKVIYTRKTDVFITLQDRALTANKNNADLFISIHCNANSNKSAYGVETFLMGLHKTDANLDVAKRENAVIKLEENYLQVYEGFDPDSPEAMIALSLNQNANITQSSFLASKVQDNFTKKLNRYDRGVKQAGFWVLYRTTMPAILIETGFLTNANEEKYLTSFSGQQDLSNAIFTAFTDYKNTLEKGSAITKNTPVITKEPEVIVIKEIVKEVIPKEEPKIVVVETPKEQPKLFDINNDTNIKPSTENTKNEVEYFVQFFVSTKPLSKNNIAYKKLKNISTEKVDGVIKYKSGPFYDFKSILEEQKKAKLIGFKDAFVVIYKYNIRLKPLESKIYLK